MHVRAGALAIVGLLICHDAIADDALSARGHLLAVQRCGICHAVGKDGPSPHRISPPFRTLHERYPVEMIVNALRTGVVSGHDEMPMFEFTQGDIQALVTYIDVLNPSGPRYLAAGRKR